MLQSRPASSGLARYRSLLAELVRKELKVRYKKSVLGFVWSLLNPLLMMAVFTVLFTIVFPQNIPLFPVFFLAGFLPWNFFAQSVSTNVPAIVGNAPLLKKIYFPRELLPMATVLAHGIHFLMALALLFVALPFLGIRFWYFLPLLVLAVVLLTVVSYGISLALSAINVFFRDVQEFVPVLLMVWFYATPIIYDAAKADAYPTLRVLIWLNPMTPIVQLFRDGLYATVWPGWRLVLYACGVSVFWLALGLIVFRALQWRFAEEV